MTQEERDAMMDAVILNEKLDECLDSLRDDAVGEMQEELYIGTLEKTYEIVEGK